MLPTLPTHPESVVVVEVAELDVGRIARTAATFCVVLTLETACFLCDAALRATSSVPAFLLFADFDLADAVFLLRLVLAALSRSWLSGVLALFAFGFEADFALDGALRGFRGCSF